MSVVISAATFKVKGDLADFPFHSVREGELRIALQVRDLVYAYLPSRAAEGGEQHRQHRQPLVQQQQGGGEQCAGAHRLQLVAALAQRVDDQLARQRRDQRHDEDALRDDHRRRREQDAPRAQRARARQQQVDHQPDDDRRPDEGAEAVHTWPSPPPDRSGSSFRRDARGAPGTRVQPPPRGPRPCLAVRAGRTADGPSVNSPRP